MLSQADAAKKQGEVSLNSLMQLNAQDATVLIASLSWAL